ncbi:MAG: glycosyltransferase family 4 protein [Dehalococcoidia bacterium]
MRIAMIAPVEMRVPPVAYGGTELVVSLLTEELVRRGHDVTLFASGDSVTSARLVSVCDRFVRGSGRDGGILTMLNVLACAEQSDQFDIIHNHTCFEGLSVAGLVSTPMLTTLHGGLQGDWLLLFKHYAGWYNTISVAMKAALPPKDRFAGVIYNAVDVDSYPFNEGSRGEHLLFLSRISFEKGPHLAIEAARRAGLPLVIAGNVHPADAEYFRTMVLPEVDGRQIRYVGEADYHAKRELLADARCLLAPITWPEPFGLFMAEAMACGTPVVAFNRGAAPEVVAHGVTGFVVETLDEMVEAIGRVDGVDPAACREHVRARFDVPRMADDYLAAYERILAAAPRRASTSPTLVAKLPIDEDRRPVYGNGAAAVLPAAEGSKLAQMTPLAGHNIGDAA